MPILSIKNYIVALLIVGHVVIAQQKPQENCGNIKTKSKKIMTNTDQLNVLGKPLALASKNPITGFYRNGYCQTDLKDRGLHVVAAIVTDQFLK